MHTLIVRYTPRQGSNTARLLDHAIAQIKGTKTEINLAELPPALLDAQRVSAYIRRNYLGETLTAADSAAMASLDACTEQLLKADAVILAAPMYNFTLPAAVKAWFDAVIQKGKTWTITEAGYAGKMQGRKALVLFSCNGVYEGAGSWDFYTPLAKALFQFMGYGAVEVMGAQGLGRDADRKEHIIRDTQARIGSLLAGWYA